MTSWPGRLPGRTEMVMCYRDFRPDFREQEFRDWLSWKRFFILADDCWTDVVLLRSSGREQRSPSTENSRRVSDELARNYLILPEIVYEQSRTDRTDQN